MANTLRLRDLDQLVAGGSPGPNDAELLCRYCETGDQEAFEGIVRRHASTVLGACRRILADAHAAEDVCQATFLQLARKSRTLRTPDTLAGWLYTTARRLALRHRRWAPPMTPAELQSPARDPLDVLTARELLAAVEEEIARLPEVYRLPLVLCYLDGQSKSVAADQLGLPAGVFRGRLDRGREKLRAALIRRGLAPAASLGLLVPTAGVVSADLIARTVGVCARGELTPPSVALLAAERASSWTRIALAAGFLIFGGLGVIAVGGSADPPVPPPTVVSSPPADPKPRQDLQGDPLPPDAIARMGSLRWRHHEEYGNQLLVVLSPTGKHVATAAVGVGVIRVFDLTDGRQVCEFPWEKPAGPDVGFTQDGSRVFYLAERGVVRYFDPTTGKPIVETKPVVEKDIPRRERGNPDVWHKAWTTHQLTKDRGWILTAHPVDDGFTLTLTEISAGTAKPRQQARLEIPPGFRKGVEVYHYNCVGDTLIGVGRDRSGKPPALVVFRWALSSGKLTKVTRCEVQENGFATSADGKRVVTRKGELRVWDTETGAEAVRLEGPTHAGHTTRFTPDGKRLVGMVYDEANESTATATVWDMESGKVVSRVEVPRQYESAFLLPDGRTLLAATRGLMFSTWDVPTGRRLSPIDGHESRIHHLAFSADGGVLFTDASDRGERITAWDAGAGKKLRELAVPGGYSRFVLTPGRGLVTATRDGTLVWADVATGRELKRVAPGPLTADLGGPISGTELAPCLDPGTGRPAVLGLVPAERGGRKLVVWWDAASGEMLFHRPFSTALGDRFSAVSPDGRLVARETDPPPVEGKGETGLTAIVGRQSVVLEDALTGRELLGLKQPDHLQSGSVLFTPDGQTLITWTTKSPPDKPAGTPAGVTTIRLWEVRSGKQRLAVTLPVIGEWWRYEPQAIAISTDGRLLAGARPDKTISVWDLMTGTEVAKRAGYGSVVDCLAFRPDGKALASGHADGTAVVWDLSGLPSVKPAIADCEAAWKDLAADDAGKAYRAILALAADPGCAGFLRDRVKPTAAPADGEVRKRVNDLGSPDFAIREKASSVLAKLGDTVETDLQAALRGDLSAEQRRRVEVVLAALRLTEPDPDRLRALRCVEVLERARSAEARRILDELAKGAAGARLTREAGGAVRRLTPRP